MIRKTFLFAATLAFAAAFALAQETKTAKVTGLLVDAMCAKADEAEVKEHSTSCALMEACVKSGFAVVSKDKVYKFDDNGNKLALDVLKNTKAKKGVAVEVAGTVEGDVIRVEKLTEIQ